MICDDDFEERLRDLLENPAHRDHPLYEALKEAGLRYARQTRLIDKVTRISDRAQSHLRDLNHHLAAASITDPLTGLPNRRHLLDRLRKETARARRSGWSLTIILGDIDHFKAVNDNYGHDVGDAVLIATAQTLQGSLRGYDLCGRWGGEEFLIILPETDIEAGMQVAEKLRLAVAAQHDDGDGNEVSISVSLGIADYDTSHSLDNCLQRADRALYAAKTMGRNCCAVAAR